MYTEDKGAPVYTLTRRNLKECKDELWERYGEDYQILSKQQDFKGGFLGFGQKEVVTVSYTVRSRGMPQRSLSKNSYSSYRNDDFQKNQEEILKMTTGNIDSIKQIAQVKQSVEELTNLINKKFEMSVSAAPDKHPSIAKIEEMLDRNEFSFAYISEISKRMSQEFSLDQLDDFDFVEKTVVDWIGESISVHPEKRFRPPHVIILVGPTGVGKTTTIAKLAANLILDAKDKGRERPQLRFISIDKTRVGALEQLVSGRALGRRDDDKGERHLRARPHSRRNRPAQGELAQGHGDAGDSRLGEGLHLELGFSNRHPRHAAYRCGVCDGPQRDFRGRQVRRLHRLVWTRRAPRGVSRLLPSTSAEEDRQPPLCGTLPRQGRYD